MVWSLWSVVGGRSEFITNKNIKIMEELITRLTQEAGISAEQAVKTLETIKDYIKEKFPMLGGAVDNMFGK